MFTKPITFGERSLVSPTADAELGYIGWAKYRGDESFGATLRALLHNRVSSDCPFTMQMRNYRITTDALDEGADTYLHNMISDNVLNQSVHDRLEIIDIMGGDKITELFSKIDEMASEDGKILHFQQPDEDFRAFWAQRGILIRFLIDPEHRTTVILAGSLNMQIWHLLQAVITRYLPWYFADQPVTKVELALVKTLTNKYAPAYESAIESFCGIIDWRSAEVKEKLTGFETRFDREQLEEIREELRMMEARRDDYYEELANLYHQYDEKIVYRKGLEEKIKLGEESSEMLDYFLANHSLDPVEVSGTKIKFLVATTIASFDPDAAEAVLRNKDSWLYDLMDGEYRDQGDPDIVLSEEQSVRLFRAVFIEEKLRARIIAAYDLDCRGRSCHADQHYTFPDDYRDYIPNMHFRRFNCFGQNRGLVENALRAADYVGTVEMCVACAQNVAVEETTTTPYYWRRMIGEGAGKFLLLPDNTPVTPAEALAWLDEQ